VDPQRQEDDYADTQVLELLDGDRVAPAVTGAGSRRDQPEPPKRTEDEIEALYQEYVRICEEELGRR
jgi:hypothetical protein